MYINLNCPTCFTNNEERSIRKALLGTDKIYLEAYFDKATDYDDLICQCGKEIKQDSFYIQSEKIMEISFLTLSESVSKKIEYCNICEGAIIDHILYENDRGRSEYDLSEQDIKDLENLGTPIPLLIPGILSHKTTNELIAMLSCQNCGFGFNKYDSDLLVNHSEFTFYDDDRAFTKKEINYLHERLNYFKLRDFASDYGITFKEEDLIEFRYYLQKHPLLGFKHPVGQQIYKLLQTHFIERHYEVLEPGVIVFRGRTISKSAINYEPNEMWNPPQTWASHGRYNPVGSSVLYCCSKEEYIPFEVNPTSKQDICIAHIHIKETLTMLNVDRLLFRFNSLIREISDVDGVYNDNYALTNYIADCCKEIGYNGIQYSGVRGEDYHNYAFLSFNKAEDMSIVYINRQEIGLQYNIINQ
ncbi:RES domain-containing protein [Paenibacillus sp. FSL R7-0216]|uniref:RES domain-containing protein n=1 Tax=Paenibacillus sp. FSL R7-0216 TaxID=2921677 RepID=UPI0030DCB54D